MKVERDGLWFCETCLFVAIYGGVDSATPEQLAASEKGLAEFGPNVVPDFDSETGDGIREFSWAGCDCCESELGGSLHRFAVLGIEIR